VLRDLETAPISTAEKALFRFVAKVNKESSRIRREDVDAVREAGWSDEALYDAISVCALFNFYNRWCDAAGVHEMSAFGHQVSGHRLATQGYVQPPTQS
jgi:alkylhydroperoxidase family enzyme